MAKFIQKYSNVVLICAFAVCAVCVLFLPLRCYKITDGSYTLYIPLLTAMVNNTFKSGGYTFTFFKDTVMIVAIIAVCVIGTALMCLNKTYILGIIVSAAGGLMVVYSEYVTVTASGCAGELHTSGFVAIIFAIMMFMAIIKAISLITPKQS